jgi:SAM-dependent methyltransferase
VSDLERQYYEQADLWANEHGDSDHVFQAVGRLVPADVRTVLDVGCGNGSITNRLDPAWQVVGGDFSLAALAHVRRPAVALSADALPFPDDSFDLVMTTDMIEHIPVALVESAIREMLRVARRYVLICVPQLEPMAYFELDCGSCGRRFHAHHHQRRYSIDDFSGIPGTTLIASASVGARWAQPDADLVRSMRTLTGVSYDFPNPSCPHCGSHAPPPPVDPRSAVVERRYEAYQYLLGEAGLRSGSCRSELVVLLAPANGSAGPLPEHDLGAQQIDRRASETIHLTTDRHRVVLENHPSDWSWTTDGDTTVLVMPRGVERMRVDSGELVSVASYDAVLERYMQAEHDDAGDWSLPKVMPAACGYRIQLQTPDRDALTLEVGYGTVPADRTELMVQAFERERTVERAEQDADRQVMLELLHREIARANSNAARVDELYADVQRLAAEVDRRNVMLNEMETTRAQLEQMLQSRGRR